MSVMLGADSDESQSQTSDQHWVAGKDAIDRINRAVSEQAALVCMCSHCSGVACGDSMVGNSQSSAELKVFFVHASVRASIQASASYFCSECFSLPQQWQSCWDLCERCYYVYYGGIFIGYCNDFSQRSNCKSTDQCCESVSWDDAAFLHGKDMHVNKVTQKSAQEEKATWFFDNTVQSGPPCMPHNEWGAHPSAPRRIHPHCVMAELQRNM